MGAAGSSERLGRDHDKRRPDQDRPRDAGVPADQEILHRGADGRRRKQRGADIMSNNPVVHFEMPYEDAERLQAFYRSVFGWQMNLFGAEMGNYVLAQTA